MKSLWRFLILVLALAVIPLTLTPWSLAEPGGSPAGDETVLPPVPATPPATTIGEEFQAVPLPAWLAGQTLAGDIRQQPFRYWRYWSNEPKPFAPTFLFCLTTSALAWLIAPAWLERAEGASRRRFWRTLLIGLTLVCVALGLARLLFLTHIGQALAVLVIGVVELGLLAGLAAASSLIGGALIGRLCPPYRSWQPRRPFVRRAAAVALGTAVITALVLLPGLGHLPRVGIRLVMLFACLGLGGLWLAVREPQSGGISSDP